MNSTIENLIDRTQVARMLANDIAASQHDLGVKSQQDMAIALSGGPSPETRTTQHRLVAYNRLDAISRFIVRQVLENFEPGEDMCLTNHFRYVKRQITDAAEVIETYERGEAA